MIIWILLLVTLNLWWDYVRTMEVKSDKEEFIWMYEKVTTTARTSNFFNSTEYTSIDIWLTTWWFQAETDAFETVWSISLTKSELSFSWSAPIITLLPYSIWCTINTGTGVDFTLVSTINDDEYCFSISDSTCKMLQVSCD